MKAKTLGYLIRSYNIFRRHFSNQRNIFNIYNRFSETFENPHGKTIEQIKNLCKTSYDGEYDVSGSFTIHLHVVAKWRTVVVQQQQSTVRHFATT